ncbi:catalase family protein [Bacillus solimangrovi]|uniref:Catalase n=1 Tax=Bacillus solimangrovi TaxID=1305675 RepID=A0A1E5LIF2_9BACI|nr:catalase family protein [Bacillus solimangrovi]OEH93863.1 hypothetical protein BFG57_11120 [Bacillus solimangrovi]
MGYERVLSKFEAVPSDEVSLIEQMEVILKGKMEKTYVKGNTKRDAHPKHLAILNAEFTVEPNLPPELKVGVFKKGNTYPAVIRVSNASGNVQSDEKPDFRGFAIKLTGVQGEKSQETDKETQDFVLMSNPTMPLGTVKLFHDAVYYSIKYSPLVLLLKMMVTGNSKILKQLKNGRKNHTSPLDIRYWSTTPYLFGNDRAVKYSLVPTSNYKSTLPTQLTDSYLTDNMEKHLKEKEATFDFMVQLYKDDHTTPIEDAGVEWKAEEAPFIKVATLKIPKQTFRRAERDELSEQLSFSPDHTLLEHRPIGGINRARSEIYRNLSKFRHDRDNRAMMEPSGPIDE